VAKCSFSSLILVATAMLIAIVLGWLSLRVYDARDALPLDRYINQHLAKIRSPDLDKFFRMIGQLGSSTVMTIIALALAVFFILRGCWSDLLVVGVAITKTIVKTQLGKWLIERPRPELPSVSFASSSYPSAHSASTMIIWGMLAYVVVGFLPGSLRFGGLCVFGAVILATVTFLVISNVHYPSDVAAGLLLGAFWLVIAIIIWKQSNCDAE